MKKNHFAGLDFSSILADWERYFREIYNLKMDFSGIRIPESSDEFSWLICRPESFFAERAFRGGKRLYVKLKWTKKSFNAVLDMSFGREGKAEPYIVRVRPNWEADDDMNNLSTDQIAKKNINTICLTERLLLGDFLYWKYKKHCDAQSSTICSGSRFIGGGVPCVKWDEGDDYCCAAVSVGWTGSRDCSSFFRSRQAVS